MRTFALPLGSLLLLTSCGPEASSNSVQPRNDVTPLANAAPTVERGNAIAPESPLANSAIASEPPEIPGVAEMSPYRRREYERGYRDCRDGDFDRERQGESYRIGCMAAEEARDAGR